MVTVEAYDEQGWERDRVNSFVMVADAHGFCGG